MSGPVVVYNCTLKCNLKCLHCYSFSQTSYRNDELNTAEAKIIRFMAEKFPLNMTKSQIAIGIGLTAKGGYFSGSFNNLVKNKLIIRDLDGDNYILAEGPP